MSIIPIISWKNVWRNKPRSLIVIGAITLGTLAGVFVAGMMKGWVDQKINAAVYTELGHLKIQNPNYLINEEIIYSLPNVEKLDEYLSRNAAVKAYVFRSKVMAMATTARGSAGVVLKGIDPEKEKTVSNVFTKILPNQGTYFEAETRLPAVLISAKTAEQLRIKNYRVTQQVLDSLIQLQIPQNIVSQLDSIKDIRFITGKKFERAVSQLWSKTTIRKYGPKLMNTAMYINPRSRITFSFTNTQGQLTYQTYRICGVFKTSNTMFDQSSAFVRQRDLAPVAGLAANQYHEISILLKDNQLLEPTKKDIATAFPYQNVMTWKELAPDAGIMADFIQVYYYIIMGIIFFALAFGIINTMLMTVLERIKELGMLMAIGMKKRKIFQMIMLETVFLTLTGAFIGMALGALLIKITGLTGLNFSSVAEGFEAVGWAAEIYPSIKPSFFFGITLMVTIIGILASIVPARKALKMKPIEAIRIE